MKKVLYHLYQPYKWLVIMPVVGISTLLVGSLVVLLTPILGARRTSLFCGGAWARLNAFLTPMWVEVTGREHVDPEQSYVIVVNHRSTYDVYVLYGWLGIDFKWVMKHELRKVPGVGIGSAALGHVFVDRSNTEAAVRSINQAKARIRDGTSVLFFPEGTRSTDGRLLPFKKGAFRMALDLGLPILPVTIVGTGEIQPPDTIRLFPGRAKLLFHRPIEVSDTDLASLPRLVRQAREAIESGLAPASEHGGAGLRRRPSTAQ